MDIEKLMRTPVEVKDGSTRCWGDFTFEELERILNNTKNDTIKIYCLVLQLNLLGTLAISKRRLLNDLTYWKENDKQ